MNSVSEWKSVSDYWMRLTEGGDPLKVQDRIAFVGNVPRVRIRPYTDRETDHLNWVDGPAYAAPPFSSLLQVLRASSEKRRWCDRMLQVMGYKLDDPQATLLDVESAVICSSSGTDEVLLGVRHLTQELPSAVYPYEGRLVVSFAAAAKTAEAYVAEHFPGVPAATSFKDLEEVFARVSEIER
jgi:hypothetical protein